MIPTRPAIADLRPYEPGRPASEVRRELGVERVVKLASNEGPYGPFPSALEAIARHAPGLNRYPELSFDLTERLAGLHGVDRRCVVLGNGADSIVGYLSAAYLDPGDEVAMCHPTFISYHLDAVKAGALPVFAPLARGAYDLDALAGRIGRRTKLVYVCNPNNPTGAMVTRAALAAFVEAVPERVLVVLDEAYHEYVTDADYPDGIALFADRPNVAVLRTFSKIYGLAGLRIGYMVAPRDVAVEVAKVRNAFDVNELAHVAAAASLDDPGELERRRELNGAGLRMLERVASDLSMRTHPACANFLCMDVGDGRALADSLIREGVVVRPLDAFGAPQCVRVTVGTPEEIALFADVLSRTLQRL